MPRGSARHWERYETAYLLLAGLSTPLVVSVHTIVSFDFADTDTAAGFDRVMSIEMFEHMKNYGLLLAKVARWMKPDAKLFIHIFCHRTFAYPYATDGPGTPKAIAMVTAMACNQ